MTDIIEDLSANSETASQTVGKLGLDRTGVILSEGYCPTCQVRSVQRSVLDYDPDEEDFRTGATAVVNCPQCLTLWRTGTNPENDLPWIEHSRASNHMMMTLTINPPEDAVVVNPFYEDDD